MSDFKRTLEQLRTKATLFWPDELRDQVAAVSILPLLLKTQNKFLSVLELSDAGPDSWKRLVETSDAMRANLFLKHLMVLSDMGRESLSKLIPLDRFFPDGAMHYVWGEKTFYYRFQKYARKEPFTSKKLCLESAQLVQSHSLTPYIEDIAMLLLHGASALNDTLPAGEKERCLIGSLMDDSERLKSFVSENYLRVSTQIRGERSNALGQLAQKYVISNLKIELPDWTIRSGHIPGVSHNDGDTETSFDIVAKSPGGAYFAIEVAFQVTTNSVIERKAGQAQARADLLHKAGHRICYVLDGAGNLNFRPSAVRVLMQFSDCTVALSRPEIAFLADYLRYTSEQTR